MIAAGADLKIYMATRPIDFRCGHDGLAAKVQEMLRLDPFSGAAFVFRSKRVTGSRFWSGIERAWCWCTNASKVASSFGQRSRTA